MTSLITVVWYQILTSLRHGMLKSWSSSNINLQLATVKLPPTTITSNDVATCVVRCCHATNHKCMHSCTTWIGMCWGQLCCTHVTQSKVSTTSQLRMTTKVKIRCALSQMLIRLSGWGNCGRQVTSTKRLKPYMVMQHLNFATKSCNTGLALQKCWFLTMTYNKYIL